MRCIFFYYNNCFHCPCFAFITKTGQHTDFFSPTGNRRSGRTRLLSQPQFPRFPQLGTNSTPWGPVKAPRVVRDCSPLQPQFPNLSHPGLSFPICHTAQKSPQTTPKLTHGSLQDAPAATSPGRCGLRRLRRDPARPLGLAAASRTHASRPPGPARSYPWLPGCPAVAG